MAGDKSGSTSQDVISSTDAQQPPVYHYRGEPVIMDSDLAARFGIETRALNQQVRRNGDKFGDDFAFQLTAEEFADLKSQNVTSSDGHGGRRKPPTMFTEHGVVMAATVVKSPQAIAASRYIVRVFVEARRNQIALTNGRNTKSVIDGNALTPHGGAALSGSLQKGETLIDRALATIVNPREGTTLRDEGEEIIAEGVGFVKEWLKKPGAGNDKIAAEIAKLIAEHDAIRGATPSASAEARMKLLAATARELRFVLAAERARETGDVEEFMQVLKELGDA
ncbi:ORF6N domain-containing protein [Qipengyuania citrea]|jgi:ORF6N domain|uniref:ORF6N domain-containing protein n=1 Tax=Qipengyuania citrea TaxID=225971 RepID=UPI00067F629B|nr:ORF6N domain-containing protein [Qipengyuania citrea]